MALAVEYRPANATEEATAVVTVEHVGFISVPMPDLAHANPYEDGSLVLLHRRDAP